MLGFCFSSEMTLYVAYDGGNLKVNLRQNIFYKLSTNCGNENFLLLWIMKQVIRTDTAKSKKLSSFFAMSDGKCYSVSKKGSRHLRIKLILLEIKSFWDTLSHFVSENGLIRSCTDKYTDLKNFRKFLSQRFTFKK